MHAIYCFPYLLACTLNLLSVDLVLKVVDRRLLVSPEIARGTNTVTLRVVHAVGPERVVDEGHERDPLVRVRVRVGVSVRVRVSG